MDVVALFFFFNDTATTEIYTLSLHDALPICMSSGALGRRLAISAQGEVQVRGAGHGVLSPPGIMEFPAPAVRSEEHTSELQSHSDLVCRLLLEKKKLIHSRFYDLPARLP